MRSVSDTLLASLWSMAPIVHYIVEKLMTNLRVISGILNCIYLAQLLSEESGFSVPLCHALCSFLFRGQRLWGLVTPVDETNSLMWPNSRKPAFQEK